MRCCPSLKFFSKILITRLLEWVAQLSEQRDCYGTGREVNKSRGDTDIILDKSAFKTNKSCSLSVSTTSSFTKHGVSGKRATNWVTACSRYFTRIWQFSVWFWNHYLQKLKDSSIWHQHYNNVNQNMNCNKENCQMTTTIKTNNIQSYWTYWWNGSNMWRQLTAFIVQCYKESHGGCLLWQWECWK